jgi:transcriptional regulator with XRE-family HTH domain
VQYLGETRDLNQSRIAEILGVDRSFISRVVAGERELSVAQIDVLAEYLNLELGAFLMLACPRSDKPLDPARARVLELCDQLIRAGDMARQALRTGVRRRATA